MGLGGWNCGLGGGFGGGMEFTVYGTVVFVHSIATRDYFRNRRYKILRLKINTFHMHIK